MFAVVLFAVIGQPMLLPALVASAAAQESPYLQPPDAPPGDSGTSALFQPLEGLPVWAQAALFSAAVVLILFLLIEGMRWAWQRLRAILYTWERRRS